MATLGYGTVGSNRLKEAMGFYDALLSEFSGHMTVNLRPSVTVRCLPSIAIRVSRWTSFIAKLWRWAPKTKALPESAGRKCISPTSAIWTATSFAPTTWARRFQRRKTGAA